MKAIRESAKSKFETMRLKAQNTLKSNIPKQGNSAIGPIKSLGELQDSIMKMREHFDFVVLGKIQSALPLQKDGIQAS